MIKLTNKFADSTENTSSIEQESKFGDWLQQMFASPDFIKMTLEFEEQTITWEKVED